MDVDLVAGIHKFIGQATFTTQAAFRSSISSKVFSIVLFEINVLIFAIQTAYQNLSLIICNSGNFRSVSLAEPLKGIEIIFLKLVELYKIKPFL